MASNSNELLNVHQILNILDECDNEESGEEDNLGIDSEDESLFGDDTDNDPDFLLSTSDGSDEDANDLNTKTVNKIQDAERLVAQPHASKKEKKGKKSKPSENTSSNDTAATDRRGQKRQADPADIEFDQLLVNIEQEKLYGKSGYEWITKKPLQTEKTPIKNVVHIRPGPTKNTDVDPLECFSLFSVITFC